MTADGALPPGLLPPGARAVVMVLVGLLSEGNYDSVERIAGGGHWKAGDLRLAVETYGRRLVMPRDFAFYDQHVTVLGQSDSAIQLDVDLLTEEVGDFDLTLSLDLDYDPELRYWQATVAGLGTL